MNKDQKVDFLKRLAKGKADLNELMAVDPFDPSIPELVWQEIELNVYTNVRGDYFEKKGIKPGELSLTFPDFRAYIKKVGRFRILIWGKCLFPGEIDRYENQKRWITFK